MRVEKKVVVLEFLVGGGYEEQYEDFMEET